MSFKNFVGGPAKTRSKPIDPYILSKHKSQILDIAYNRRSWEQAAKEASNLGFGPITFVTHRCYIINLLTDSWRDSQLRSIVVKWKTEDIEKPASVDANDDASSIAEHHVEDVRSTISEYALKDSYQQIELPGRASTGVPPVVSSSSFDWVSSGTDSKAASIALCSSLRSSSDSSYAEFKGTGRSYLSTEILPETPEESWEEFKIQLLGHLGAHLDDIGQTQHELWLSLPPLSVDGQGPRLLTDF